MSKELDALERGILEFEKELEDDCNNEWLKRVVAGMKKCYQRLESIDNAKPNEALECWRYLSAVVPDWAKLLDNGTNALIPIKQSLLKAQEQEKENAELKRVLSVIKEKCVDIFLIKQCQTCDDYNRNSGGVELTEEEFELLERWMENDK